MLDARSPLWTPNGESIIFAGSAAGSGIEDGIYRMDANGANVERIRDLTFWGFSLDPHAMSPDGTTVAVNIDPNVLDLYLVDLATDEDVLIAGEDEDEYWPVWSPDGSLLAFTKMHPTSLDAVQEAMLYDVASGETISLGELGEVNGWSPDGHYIVTWLDGILAVVDVTDPTAPVATEVEGVTEADGPSWQPRP